MAGTVPEPSVKKTGSSRLSLEVEVPVNATATIRVPTPDPSTVTEGGRPAQGAPGVTALPGDSRGGARFEVGSGRYVFAADVRVERR
jgi:alpha-L-rhamnosidase